MKRTGWLVLETTGMDDPLRAIEFKEDEPLNAEPPYSNDEGLIQIHLEIEFLNDPNEYPIFRVIE